MSESVEQDRATIDKYLAELPDDYSPLAELARRYDPQDVCIEQGNIMLIGHEPERAPKAYAVTVFPGLTVQAIEVYENINSLIFPETLKGILQQINGAHLLDLSIYGIPPSMLKDPPLLSRSIRNPLDIGTAAKIWRVGCHEAKPGEFHFASRNIGWSGKVGYFIRPDESVVSYPFGETNYESRTWPMLATWLRDELQTTINDRSVYLAEVARNSTLRQNSSWFSALLHKLRP